MKVGEGGLIIPEHVQTYSKCTVSDTFFGLQSVDYIYGAH